MTDPLSVTASIVGLVIAADQVRTLLSDFIGGLRDAPRLCQYVMDEVHSMKAIFCSLQSFLSGDRQSMGAREALITVNDLVVTLTGCVCTFSELQTEIKDLKSGSGMSVLDRAKWATKQSVIFSLFDRLQQHKSSLTLMLTVLQCKSDAQASRALEKLCVLVGELLESNQHLSERLRRVETGSTLVSLSGESNSLSIRPRRSLRRSWSQATTIANNSPVRATFESILRVSKVYRRAFLAGGYSTHSTTGSLNLSAESQSLRCQQSSIAGLSLSDVSNISEVSLPILPSDISNSDCYSFGANVDAPSVDAPSVDAPSVGAPSVGAPSVDARPADAKQTNKGAASTSKKRAKKSAPISADRRAELDRIEYFTLVASIGC